MTNKNRSIISSVKGKLVAAVAMLLIGAFMLISSSYAWFTLSTAPELTGVYTSVGANGNLEMALVPSTGISGITSGVGDSGKNETWGNIVDLGNGNAYGLSQIQLMPARLDVKGDKENGYTLNGLSAPVYGADGRVDSLVAAVQGIYKDGSWIAGTGNGVTAIGTASGMSAQQTAWIQYKRNVSSALASAQAKADHTFEVYGTPLANVVMTKALQGEGATFNISFVDEMIAELEAANNDLAVAAKWYFAAKAAEGLYDVDDATWALAVEAISALDFATLSADATSVTINGQDVPFDNTLKAVMAQYNEIKTKLAATKSAWAAFKADTTKDEAAADWADTREILITTGFLNYEQIKVNGQTTAELGGMMGTDGEISDELVNFGMAFVQNGVVDFTSGSGVHADFAEVIGEYQAEISVTVTFKGTDFTNDKVKLRTVVDADGTRVDMYAALANQPADNTADGAVKPLTEFYGYMIDLAFRTNAKGSSLMLQTTPVGRIYETDGSEATMGHGSTMTFSTTDLTMKQVKELMAAVRIVFLDQSGNIVAIGVLEQEVGGGNYEISANNEITSSIYLYDFDFNADGSIRLTNKIEADKDGKTELMALAQNTATQLSALVYLDGDVVDNSMVSAENVASLTGSLNLQFSSSAELKPMEYGDLKGDGAESESATESESVEETTSNTENN